MVSEVIIVVAGQQREDETPPQFSEISRDVMPELTNGIGNECVGAGVIRWQAKQSRCGNERNPLILFAVKPGYHGNAVFAHLHEAVLRDLNSALRRQGECKYFPSGYIPRVVGFRKFRQSYPAVRQRNRGFRSRPAKRGAGAKEEFQISRRFGIGVDGIGSSQQSLETDEGWQVSDRRCKERTFVDFSKAQCAQPGAIIQSKHVIDVAIRLLSQDLFSDGSFDQ